MNNNKKNKFSKFLDLISVTLIPFLSINIIIFNANEIVEFVSERSNASAQEIQRNIDNYNFMRDKIVAHYGESVISPYSLKIFTKSVKNDKAISIASLMLLNLRNKWMLKIGDILEYFPSHFSSNFNNQLSLYLEKNYEILENKITAYANTYYYSPGKLNSEVYLNVDGVTIEKFAQKVFAGDTNLAMDYIAFHEFTHYVAYNLAEHTIFKDKSHDIIEKLKQMDEDNVLVEDIENNKKLLEELYMETLADIMSLQLLEAKYPALDIEIIAKRLGLARSDDAKKRNSVTHLTSIGLIYLKNSKPGQEKNYIQMYKTADRLALKSVYFTLDIGAEETSELIDGVRAKNKDRKEGSFYKKNYNYNVNEKFLNTVLNYKNHYNSLKLEASVLSEQKIEKIPFIAKRY